MTNTVLWTNRATSALSAAITDTQTTFTVASGQGAQFPSPGSGQFFPVILQSASNSTTYEIAYCTSRSTDTFTVARGQEGTTGQAFNQNDLVLLEPTAGTMALFMQWGQRGFQSYSTAGTYTFTAPVSVFTVIITGGGAGGANCDATSTIPYDTNMSGGGGGAGATAILFMSGVTVGTTYTVVVGAGGATQSDGAVSSFGSVTAYGGTGATFTSLGNSPGAAGGSVSGGTVNLQGGYGSDGQTTGAAWTFPGNGGSSYWGAGGRAGASGGLPGSVPGSGGGGAYDAGGSSVTYSGGAGATGIVVVVW